MTAGTNQFLISVIILVKLFLSGVYPSGDSNGNLENGFCTKSEDGIKCLSEGDITLRRLESSQVH